MQYLDGKRLKKAVNAGWLWLNRHRERLNAINVFPVADGDTGTNMARTLQAAVAGAYSTNSTALNDVADAIAVYSLRGARGNSGVILSQYFKGVAEFVGQRKRIRWSDVAGAFTAGAESAYKSVREPKEGTILTVVREVAEHVEEVKPRSKGLRSLLESAVERGRESLANTRFRLKVLSEANVVDAGGQGFLHFIEGIHHLVKTGEMGSDEQCDDQIDVIPRDVDEHCSFRYCSEYLVKGRGFDSDCVKRQLEGAGDSLIVATSGFGNEHYLKIHIHTDRPEDVERLATALGTIEKRKVDDMQAQEESAARRRVSLRRTQRKTIRIVTDSTCDLPRAVSTSFDIEVVPLKVMFGADAYLDGVDLHNDYFYHKLATSSLLPTTSQPSPGDFASHYRSVFERGDCEEILSIHLSSKLSGTYNSSLTAASEFGGRVTSFDSQTVSLGLGLMAIAAAEMATEGSSLPQILDALQRIRNNQGLVFTLGTLEYLVKGGRIGKARAFLGKLLGLKPVLALVNGEIVPVGKARNEEKLTEKIFSLLPPASDDTRWAVAHGNCASRIAVMVNLLEERLGVEDILTGEIGPTVGTHAGPGCWGIFYMKG